MQIRNPVVCDASKVSLYKTITTICLLVREESSIRISLITIAFSVFLCTCIRLNYMLGALAISQMEQLDIAINNRYECCFSMYGINLKTQL